MPRRKKNKILSAIDKNVQKNILAVVVIVVGLIFTLSLFDLAGIVGEKIDEILALLFGWVRFSLPVAMIVLSVLYFKSEEKTRYLLMVLGAVIFILAFLGLVHIFNDMDKMLKIAKNGQGAGLIGYILAYPLTKFVGKIAGVIILAAVFFIGLMLAFNSPLSNLIKSFKGNLRLKKTTDSTEYIEYEEVEEVTEPPDVEEVTESPEVEDDEEPADAEGSGEAKEEETEDNIKSIKFVDDPFEKALNEPEEEGDEKGLKNDYANFEWNLPPLSLLEKSQKKAKVSNIKENVQIILRTFAHFGVKLEPHNYSVGPTVTQYTFRPAVGVKVSKVLALQNDLALALAAHPLRIEAPVPGKSLIGIEVPNKKKSDVRLRSLLENKTFQQRDSNLTLALGENVNGHPITASIEKMPHLMVAGSTGTGKSVCVNSMITSLLYQNSPEDLRLILVDPKRVELTMYNGIPHLLAPVIVDTSKVVNALKWAVGEMERRYKLLQEVGSRNIHSYNQKAAEADDDEWEKMPFIVIIIDELADLMAAHGKEVEGLIVRLAQMARAVGIHLVVSTQRPSVEVITGLIKANITTRIAFQVATQIDSRTILDMRGAEKLIGQGDMLYLGANSTQPQRVQGGYISEQEVKKVVKFIKKQAKNTDFEEDEELAESLDEQLDSPVESDGSGSGHDAGADDELYEQAKEIVLQAKKASTSMLQRRLKIGYSRAARIVDLLEENGVVGPQEGSKPRAILASTSYQDPAADQQQRENWE